MWHIYIYQGWYLEFIVCFCFFFILIRRPFNKPNEAYLPDLPIAEKEVVDSYHSQGHLGRNETQPHTRFEMSSSNPFPKTIMMHTSNFICRFMLAYVGISRYTSSYEGIR